MFKGTKIVLFAGVMVITLLFTGVAAAQYQEAPGLGDLVEQGMLPPVNERLPAEPVVVPPRESIGQYGGTWTTTVELMFAYIMYEPLVVQDAYDDSKLKPNLATSWEISDDYTKYTFHLREGVKWSDGEDFTSEDLMFWWHDRMLNNEIEPIAIPAMYRSVDDNVPTVTALNDHTIVFEFTAPAPDFMYTMVLADIVFEGGIQPTPKHYLTQYHKDYADPDELDRRVRQAGYDKWYQLFEVKADPLENPNLPTLYPWVLETDPREHLQIASRNPYYWKVDPEGNQLPYIDKIQWEEIEDEEVRIMKAMNGEIDLAQISTVTENVPVLRMAEQAGNYRTVLMDLSALNGAGVVLYFNHNYYDRADTAVEKETGQFLRNRDFRIALSLAIDREEVNEFVGLGLAEIRQPTFNEITLPTLTDEQITRYTEFDPERASEMLDAIGLDERDSEGYRILPETGERLRLIISPTAANQFRVDAGILIERNWRDIGVHAMVRTEEHTLWVERRQTGEHMINVFGTAATAGVESGFYLPITVWCHFAPLYGRYYATGGAEGIPPEGDWAVLMDLYRKLRETIDEDERIAIIDEIQEMHLENLWQVGVIGYSPWVAVAHNRMQNVQEQFFSRGWNPLFPDAEQYWIDPTVPR